MSATWRGKFELNDSKLKTTETKLKLVNSLQIERYEEAASLPTEFSLKINQLSANVCNKHLLISQVTSCLTSPIEMNGRREFRQVVPKLN